MNDITTSTPKTKQTKKLLGVVKIPPKFIGQLHFLFGKKMIRRHIM